MRHKLVPLEFKYGIDLVNSFSIPVMAVVGDVKTMIYGYPYVSPIVEGIYGTLSFFYSNRDIENLNVEEILRSTKASIIITYSKMFERLNQWGLNNKLFVLVDDPKSIFMRLLIEMTEPVVNTEFINCPSSCYVGPNVHIEKGVVIGKNCIFMGNNYVYDGSKIGNNVIIKPGAVIGGCGYGFLTKDKKHTLLPHIGGIIIEDDVLIGANTCIDSGLIGNTLIRSGAKVDNLVHIAHNVIIGKNTMVIANAMIAGSVHIGDNSQISPSTSIRQQLVIGNDSVVGMHSCVTKNVGDNILVYGVPARVYGDRSNKKLEDNK
jgi:UDP-3-O-[3-hydroxymyristoyl] glucosamine N-acyltransferase